MVSLSHSLSLFFTQFDNGECECIHSKSDLDTMLINGSYFWVLQRKNYLGEQIHLFNPFALSRRYKIILMKQSGDSIH